MIDLDKIVTPEEALDYFDELVLEHNKLTEDLREMRELDIRPYQVTLDLIQARIADLDNRLTLARNYAMTLPC